MALHQTASELFWAFPALKLFQNHRPIRQYVGSLATNYRVVFFILALSCPLRLVAAYTAFGT